jgi:hypothetical protein
MMKGIFAFYSLNERVITAGGFCQALAYWFASQAVGTTSSTQNVTVTNETSSAI